MKKTTLFALFAWLVVALFACGFCLWNLIETPTIRDCLGVIVGAGSSAFIIATVVMMKRRRES